MSRDTPMSSVGHHALRSEFHEELRATNHRANNKLDEKIKVIEKAQNVVRKNLEFEKRQLEESLAATSRWSPRPRSRSPRVDGASSPGIERVNSGHANGPRSPFLSVSHTDSSGHLSPCMQRRPNSRLSSDGRTKSPAQRIKSPMPHKN